MKTLTQNCEVFLVSWSFETLLENVKNNFPSFDEKIPLTMVPMRLFNSSHPDGSHQSLLNFQPLLIKSFYNRHQFDFFFSDEQVTDSLIYTSTNNPCYIFGTNYGRIFIVPLFQESDEKVQPVLVVDSHHGSSIQKLFIAYNSSRKSR